ncbi:poly-gamma-glutamate synthase PgsB, partial [Streptomyces sp. SAS_269]
INCRPDRVERNGQMGTIVPDLAAETVFLIGHPTKSAGDAIPAGFTGRVVDLGGDRRDPEELTAAILAELGPDSSLVAIGNIHGQGELFLESLAELPLDDSEDPLDLVPDGDGLDQETMQFAIPRARVSVARPPEPEPYSWVAPLDSPTYAFRVPEQRELARRAAARQGRPDDRSTAGDPQHSYDPTKSTRNP